MRKMKFGILLVFAMLVVVGTVSAFGPITFDYNGDLVVTYVNSSADYHNVFGIASPVDKELGAIHEPDAAAPGTEYDVGRCSNGAPVVLYIETPGGYTYPSDQNGPDGKNHALVTGPVDGVYTVGFEDIYDFKIPGVNGCESNGEPDYNDVFLSVACTPDPINAPEFPTLALPAGLIIGMLGVVLFIQKTKEE
jgi:hypothetical protein